MYTEYLEEIAINGVNIPEFAVKKRVKKCAFIQILFAQYTIR